MLAVVFLREAKDSQGVLLELFAHYRALSPEDRLVVDDLLADLATSSEGSVRFDALALINEFRSHFCPSGTAAASCQAGAFG